MKEIINEIRFAIEDKIRSLCGAITPDKRVTVVLSMLMVFAALSLYFFVTSIYNWGKETERKRQIEIEYIRKLELEKRERDYYEFLDAEIGKRFNMPLHQETEQDTTTSENLKRQ
jgi:hypothetical protein